ncbi:calmodulin-binding protein 25-like [Punica granatum]|uniref:VQ domain-containing protein n=2 Tax=Punica granatum TaxID=22663 RepID=A0A218WM68_PUNGR|nr:calmodulin-binding protein 25-like [Punica granatum]OWM73112.1 hypothetical protein CDL15_Pgr001226 [Punica granatum]PKI58959.1 hypothetical protein CRG98_020705 [Punica granatum]
MASSDHMASVDPWAQIRPAFLDPWFADLFSRDTDSFTKALLKSDDHPLSPFPSAQPEAAPTRAASSVSASSDPDSASKRPHNPIPSAPRGRVSKRKSRASKRSQTTFITADAANFRQMVQQVTGVRFVGAQPPVLKPEPQRPTGRQLPPGADGGCLPTLDAVAWLQNLGGAVRQEGPVPLIAAPSPGAADGGVAGVLSFDSAGCFPTLESWKAI